MYLLRKKKELLCCCSAIDKLYILLSHSLKVLFFIIPCPPPLNLPSAYPLLPYLLHNIPSFLTILSFLLTPSIPPYALPLPDHPPSPHRPPIVGQTNRLQSVSTSCEVLNVIQFNSWATTITKHTKTTRQQEARGGALNELTVIMDVRCLKGIGSKKSSVRWSKFLKRAGSCTWMLFSEHLLY